MSAGWEIKPLNLFFMQKPELIQHQETIKPQTQESPMAEGGLSIDAVSRLYGSRLGNLERLRPLISLKLYYGVVEKLEQEKAQLLRFLRWEDTKQDILSNYSFVLDTSYFEQKFFSH